MFYSPSTGGFYADTQSRPKDAVSLTDQDYQSLLDGQGEGGRIVADKDGKPHVVFPEVALADTISDAKRTVDGLAEQERLKYITPGQGQALTYQRKVEEAKSASEDKSPSPEKYPLLAASVGIDGDSIKDVATIVLSMDAEWATVGAAIERVRLETKKALSAASSASDVTAILQQFKF